MDEVHVVPAAMFRKAMERISCHCKVVLFTKKYMGLLLYASTSFYKGGPYRYACA
jgi:hypothetical protein